MNKEEAVSIIKRYGPCTHDTTHTAILGVTEFVICEDCGAEILPSMFNVRKGAAEEFYEAVDYVEELQDSPKTLHELQTLYGVDSIPQLFFECQSDTMREHLKTNVTQLNDYTVGDLLTDVLRFYE